MDIYTNNSDILGDYRPQLFATAYKMTQSMAEAEDILQDAQLALLAVNAASISSPRAYLMRTVVNKSINSINKRKLINYPGIDLPEPLTEHKCASISQYDVTYGLLLLLQRLNPQERAVFILRESFDYEYAEIAEILDITTDNCRQIYHRSKERVGKKTSRFNTSAAENRAFSEAFMKAASGELSEFVKMLKKDMIIYSDGGGKVSAAIHPIIGLENCLKFLQGLNAKRGNDLYSTSTSLNGQPAMVFYLKETNAVDTIVLLENEENSISAMYVVRNPDKFF